MNESFKDTIISSLRQEVLYLRNALKDRNEDIKRLLQLLQNVNIFEREIQELSTKDKDGAGWKKEKFKEELSKYYDKEYDYKTLKSKLLAKYADIEDEDEKAKHRFGNQIDSSLSTRGRKYSTGKDRTIYSDNNSSRDLSPTSKTLRFQNDVDATPSKKGIFKNWSSPSKDRIKGKNIDIDTIYDKGTSKMSKIMSKYRRNGNENKHSSKSKDVDLKRVDARHKSSTNFNKYDLSQYEKEKEKERVSYETSKAWSKIGNSDRKKDDIDGYKSIYTSSRKLSPGRISPRRLSTERLSPERMSPRQLSPARYSPRQLSPARYSPRQLSPARYSPRHLSPSRWSSNDKLDSSKLDTDYKKTSYSRKPVDLKSKVTPQKNELSRREEIGRKYLPSNDYDKHFDTKAKLNSYKKYSSSDDLNFRIKSDNVKCGICKFCDDDDLCSKTSKKYLDNFPETKGTRFEHDNELHDQYVKFLDLKEKLARVRSMDNVHAASSSYDDNKRKNSTYTSRLDELKEFENRFKRNNMKLKKIRSMDDLDRNVDEIP